MRTAEMEKKIADLRCALSNIKAVHKDQTWKKSTAEQTDNGLKQLTKCARQLVPGMWTVLDMNMEEEGRLKFDIRDIVILQHEEKGRPIQPHYRSLSQSVRETAQHLSVRSLEELLLTLHDNVEFCHGFIERVWTGNQLTCDRVIKKIKTKTQSWCVRCEEGCGCGISHENVTDFVVPPWRHIGMTYQCPTFGYNSTAFEQTNVFLARPFRALIVRVIDEATVDCISSNLVVDLIVSFLC
jgi:hypothetical protein